MEPDSCPLCELIVHGNFLFETEVAVAMRDPYPLTPGHTLVLPRRHEPDFFALVPAEWRAIGELLVMAKEKIQEAYHPDGFNVGVDVGVVAGQRRPHAHVHVIPRFSGDVEDPHRTGMRWIVPARATLERGQGQAQAQADAPGELEQPEPA